MSATDLSDDDLENYDSLFKKFFIRWVIIRNYFPLPDYRGGSRNFVTSKMELFMTIVKGWKPLTIVL